MVTTSQSVRRVEDSISGPFRSLAVSTPLRQFFGVRSWLNEVLSRGDGLGRSLQASVYYSDQLIVKIIFLSWSSNIKVLIQPTELHSTDFCLFLVSYCIVIFTAYTITIVSRLKCVNQR